MSVFELCSLLSNPNTQEVIIYDDTSLDCDMVLKDSADVAMFSDYANSEIRVYELAEYVYGPILVIYIFGGVL